MTWPIKLRIAASATVGILVMGFLAWPLIAPDNRAHVVSLITAGTGLTEVLVLLLLAFVVGLVAYFLTWPYGRHIAPLAVPAGLAVWALRSQNISKLLQLNPAPDYRQHILLAIKWESFFYLALAAAGVLAVLLAQRIKSPKQNPLPDISPSAKPAAYINAALSLLASLLLAFILITAFAQNTRFDDQILGSVVAQPAKAQICFAVTAAFALITFAAAKFLKIDYLVPACATALLTPVAVTTYLRREMLACITDRWPALFFANPLLAILPVQLVAFGSVGSVIGYYIATRCEFAQPAQRDTRNTS